MPAVLFLSEHAVAPHGPALQTSGHAVFRNNLSKLCMVPGSPAIVHQSIELTMLAMAMQQRVIIPVGSSCCGELKALPANDPVYGSCNHMPCHCKVQHASTQELHNMHILHNNLFFYFSKTNASHTFTLYRNSRPSLGRLETAGCNAA